MDTKGPPCSPQVTPTVQLCGFTARLQHFPSQSRSRFPKAGPSSLEMEKDARSNLLLQKNNSSERAAVLLPAFHVEGQRFGVDLLAKQLLIL
jgi:hypothetical protein